MIDLNATMTCGHEDTTAVRRRSRDTSNRRAAAGSSLGVLCVLLVFIAFQPGPSGRVSASPLLCVCRKYPQPHRCAAFWQRAALEQDPQDEAGVANLSSKILSQVRNKCLHAYIQHISSACTAASSLHRHWPILCFSIQLVDSSFHFLACRLRQLTTLGRKNFRNIQP
jgi:hypothetical protein